MPWYKPNSSYQLNSLLSKILVIEDSSTQIAVIKKVVAQYFPGVSVISIHIKEKMFQEAIDRFFDYVKEPGFLAIIDAHMPWIEQEGFDTPGEFFLELCNQRKIASILHSSDHEVVDRVKEGGGNTIPKAGFSDREKFVSLLSKFLEPVTKPMLSDSSKEQK